MQSSSWAQFNIVLGILSADLEFFFNKFRFSEIPIRAHVNFGPQNDPVRVIQPTPAFAC